MLIVTDGSGECKEEAAVVQGGQHREVLMTAENLEKMPVVYVKCLGRD